MEKMNDEKNFHGGRGAMFHVKQKNLPGDPLEENFPIRLYLLL